MGISEDPALAAASGVGALYTQQPEGIMGPS
jgi:hypothetical protein